MAEGCVGGGLGGCEGRVVGAGGHGASLGNVACEGEGGAGGKGGAGGAGEGVAEDAAGLVIGPVGEAEGGAGAGYADAVGGVEGDCEGFGGGEGRCRHLLGPTVDSLAGEMKGVLWLAEPVAGSVGRVEPEAEDFKLQAMETGRPVIVRL